MIDCSCYHDEINLLGKRGACWGTKEREPCSCDGDAAKCDFYPSVRSDEKKPLTNADRIRAMSDEELAAFFAQQKYRKPAFDSWLPLCNYVMGPRMCHEDGCEACWLDWLRQEAAT